MQEQLPLPASAPAAAAAGALPLLPSQMPSGGDGASWQRVEGAALVDHCCVVLPLWAWCLEASLAPVQLVLDQGKPVHEPGKQQANGCVQQNAGMLPKD